MNNALGQLKTAAEPYHGQVTLPCSTVSEEHIRLMFRALMSNVPIEANARQQYRSEEKNGYIYLQIVSSFKIRRE